MAYSSERWSRGCGTGVGLSGQKNQFRLGVDIENWVEDRQALQDAVTGSDTLWTTPGVGFLDITTNKTAFSAAGTFGPQILVNSDRKDLQAYPGTDFHHKVSHGLDPSSYGSVTHFSSLNSLTLNTPQNPKTKVQANLFHGTKFNDIAVPRDLPSGARQQGELMSARMERLAQQRAESPYTTTNQAVHGGAAEQARQIHASGERVKPDICMPSAEGGQRAQIGRKAKGECCSEFDQEFQKTALRKPL
mmetsp:Transcript_35001/g.48532  ORF Transcript_35001/g.48532 Transcript_35001/m.48532 type:complete len:247 (-) Transcript_35001:164-904(-)|eukprot:CAMPEP_0196590526 /NCGR_PEP_ID=MMETSP1081-20130531/66872_1 /TAXON_ID=36882 /ORGANISM="Pyramimonas amylifera, Strain CCMP720" /LENGTH=246 /DNA_ID=CAMNT_0041913661 /DNA_START=128 /DNA_END=868 /DNA_ORIENTATION=-